MVSFRFLFLWIAAGILSCQGSSTASTTPEPVSDPFVEKLCESAVWQTKQKVKYDGSYYRIDYPGGDVPESIGVCTDVIIRAYRKTGYDLQQLIHEDMKKAKAEYDRRRKSPQLDRNIDHRRVPNIQTFLERKGAKQPITRNEADYLPGDIVCWDVAAGHIGLVVNHKVPGTSRYMIVHNICCGPQLEDFLFRAAIVGHYRWHPPLR